MKSPLGLRGTSVASYILPDGRHHRPSISTKMDSNSIEPHEDFFGTMNIYDMTRSIIATVVDSPAIIRAQ
jgi:hypothetical protein